jgi:hypothetical protein
MDDDYSLVGDFAPFLKFLGFVLSALLALGLIAGEWI